MALFQNSILKKYLNQLDEATVEKQYKKYTKYFHDPKIQENIRQSKEEEFQGIFLSELFDKILGYTMKPNANFNLVAEYKNEKNSKKADGAILKEDSALAVIELKGTKTKDLESIRQQAFDYKANQTGCVYVVTSNYEKLRFYINNAVEFEEFYLFNLTFERFKLMYLCLSQEYLLKNVPLQMQEASVAEEEGITKKFYSDYSVFKRELYRDLVKLNMKNEVFRNELSNEDQDRATKNIKLSLFKKSQKLIDRFLFIFFAEDRGLLPPNSTVKILDDWNRLQELDEVVPLYNRFKKYFGYLDQGRKGTEKRAEIFAYNGGLFKPDAVLDSLLISDNLLVEHTGTLANYDFESQVDVNILGHIFENSLNEIESVNAEIEGGEFDKQKTKRKKDGVFYTPKYITKYIVDNTVGKLCTEKKNELGIVEEEYLKSRKGRKTATLQSLQTKLEDYRSWLLTLTILDPACGSGAFLNQALDFLIKEHEYIDYLSTSLLGGGFTFPDIENTVLENNIYGVDLNEESVEIAKLSLWLRTAQPRRKLNSLNKNIKCGNSLIDSKTVAGDKAFKWEEEFPEVFDPSKGSGGGFDVVIGNPPYVPTELINDTDKTYLESTYESAYGRLNLYPIFYEKGIKVLCQGGQLSFITPYTILKNQYYIEARKYILSHTSINELIDFKGIAVFEDATVDSIILSLSKEKNIKNKYSYIFNIKDFQNNQFQQSEVFQEDILNSKDVSFHVSNNDKLIKKVSKGCKTLAEVVNFNQGIITGGNKKFITSERNELSVKVLTGSDFNRYLMKPSSSFLTYDTSKLHRPRKKEIFEVDEKILLRQTGAYPICSIDYDGFYTLDTVHNGILTDHKFQIKYILALINSKLYRFLYENSINESGKVFAQVKIIYIDPLPVKTASIGEQGVFVNQVDLILKLNKDFSSISSSFLKYLTSQFELTKLSKKLQNWHELDFGEFIKELNKAIKANNKLRVQEEKEPVALLTKLQEMEWMEVFETKKAEAQALKTEIEKTDKEIDQMVYELYGLSEEEIEIVEKS